MRVTTGHSKMVLNTRRNARRLVIRQPSNRLATALRVARRTRSIALESVLAGLGLSVIAMIVAAFDYRPPVAGAFIQEAIDDAVILTRSGHCDDK